MGRPAGAALAAAILVLGVGAVIAQSDPIATRMALMKENNENAKLVVGMMRGQVPFDAAKVDAAFVHWADTAQKLPSLFPDNSKSGQKTRAAPKIWTAKADFDAKAATFGKLVGVIPVPRATGDTGSTGLDRRAGCDRCDTGLRARPVTTGDTGLRARRVIRVRLATTGATGATGSTGRDGPVRRVRLGRRARRVLPVRSATGDDGCDWLTGARARRVRPARRVPPAQGDTGPTGSHRCDG